MLLEVVSVCRRQPAWVATCVDDYARRFPRPLELGVKRVPPASDGASAAERRRDEGRRLLAHFDSRAQVVALARDGRACSSEELAGWLADWRLRHDAVSFVIGGADGLDAAVLARADRRWSLSRLTFPHLMVQVIVAEQLYRAWTILEGHPYHRA